MPWWSRFPQGPYTLSGLVLVSITVRLSFPPVTLGLGLELGLGIDRFVEKRVLWESNTVELNSV